MSPARPDSWIALALVAGIFGYPAHWQQRAPDRRSRRDRASRVAAEPAPERKLGRIAFKPCSLLAADGRATPGSAVRHACRCRRIPRNPKGRKIALNIAWLPADERATARARPGVLPRRRPGPGGDRSYAGMIAGASREVRKQRDIVLVDQRGTGKSNPLECKFDDDDKASPERSMRGRDADESPQASRAMAIKCRDQLARKRRPALLHHHRCGARPRRGARGARREQINLMGVSYGTRVAQQYAMRHPQHTRTIVLDGVAPNALVSATSSRATSKPRSTCSSAQCAKTPACTQRARRSARAACDALMAKLRAERRW